MVENCSACHEASMRKFEQVFPNIQRCASVTIPSGMPVLLRKCALPTESQTDPAFVLGVITVPSGASNCLASRTCQQLQLCALLIDDG